MSQRNSAHRADRPCHNPASRHHALTCLGPIAALCSAALPGLALARPASLANAAVDGEIAAIVVTGSRLGNDFDVAMPVTLAAAGDLRDAAPTSLADGLNQLPAFNNSTKTANPGTAAASGDSGQNLLNLRGLGPNRGLILLDGKRMIATNFLGSSDINMLPQALVKRVEVVTGGASAAYGSDAVSGVVNFVIDREFDGVKASVLSAVSTRGDLPALGGSIAFGKTMAGGRLRLLGSFDYFREDGIRADQPTGRRWFDRAAGQYPVPGAPTAVTVVPDIRSSAGSYGGLVTSGPLKGTSFLPDGALGGFDYGSLTSASFQNGGDGPRINIGFAPRQQRHNAYLRASYDLSDRVEAYAEGLYASSYTNQGAFVLAHTGATNGFTIFRDNAFLPAGLADLMDTYRLSSIAVGRFSSDFPLVEIESLTKVYRGLAGLSASLGHGWKLDGLLSFSHTRQQLAENNLTINRNLYAAVDAVRDASGHIVCRSVLAGLDQGCVPLNIFGLGAPSEAAIAYVTGNSVKWLGLEQTVASLNASGDLGETWTLGAGPVALAAGIEYRRESARQTTDPLSSSITRTDGLRGAPAAQNNRAGGFNFYNPLPFAGSFDTREGYFEIGVPVLRDTRLGRYLGVNLALRHAVYGSSGGVTTWKLGGEYEPDPGLKLRIVRSRDIRAASILERFNPASQSSLNTLYQGKTTQTFLLLLGNPDLRPERADTLTYGAIIEPAFAKGLRLSVQRYVINIRDAIGSLTAQQEIDGCAAGNQLLCGLITVTPQDTLIVRAPSLNLAVQKASGIDFEANFVGNLAGQTLFLRSLATRRTAALRRLAGSSSISTLGQPDTPKWSANIQARLAGRTWSVFAQERFISASLFDANKVEGTDTNLNHTPAVWYTDATLTVALGATGHGQELFMSVNNLFDRDPPIATSNPTSFSSPTSSAYDPVGRYLSVGLRARF
jgi:outer membrane receptor protein involved in Fe transport